jgi:poly(3-hydroxybutyrate) depolymerase
MGICRLLVVGALVIGLSAPALAQAPPNLASARVRYNTLKNSATLNGELKAQIDAIDQGITNALRLGQPDEVRRLIAKGSALLSNRAWTEVDEYDHSLVLRADRVFIDSSRPYTVRLGQAYQTDIELTNPLSARVSLRPLIAQPPGGPEARPLATFPVSRDLLREPLMMELDLTSVPDGPHVLDVQVLDGARTLASVSLRLAVKKGLDARLAALDTLASMAPESVRPSIRYPADYLRKVNDGLIEMGLFDLTRELAAAESIAQATRDGKDPFVGRTGDFKRHYVLEPANEIMPYRVYVPTTYTGSKPLPLVVALHGLGANEDSFMDGYARRLPQLAEQHGFIVVTPLGYRVDGFYGYNYRTDAASRREHELSELDVMRVLERMRRDYQIDERRIYLMGHSMGAIGTWWLAAHYPDVWAAIGPIAGIGDPVSVARMKHIPQFVVHGDADPTVSVVGSRTMVAALKKHGVDHIYVEVAGGGHSDIVVPNLAAMFQFFETKRQKPAGTSRR